ncbi:hypothetical protein BKA83DRAFT_4492105 [Pisolithus microcarpus]|nr:hypothetical protein BKA83DRAFT_4492105 [Pisolithus microcarpus]
MSLCSDQSPECPDSSPAAVSHTYNSVCSQKRLGLVHGTPCYSPIQEFTDEGLPACTYQYSNNGRLFIYAFPSSVRISQAENATPMQELNVVELNFSPRGTYIFTWECPVELEDGTTLQPIAHKWNDLDNRALIITRTAVDNASMRDFALPSQCGR